MKSRAFGAVLLGLYTCLTILDFSTATSELDTSVTNSTEEDEHNKLLLDCQHPDYRTYIKCLKRHKRHHWHGEHDDGGDSKHKCFDECGMDQCESSKCVHDCHKRCMKKTKETRQIITQYETTCDSDDCKENAKNADLPTTNITTNIDINNVINNHMPKPEVWKCLEGGCTSGGKGGNTGGGAGGNTGGGQPSGGIVPSCGGLPCSGGGGWYGNTGLTLIPQIQLVPQLTFGLGAVGFGGFGGGYWPHGQPGGVDCSPCGNPLLRYKCDVSCYGVQGTGQMMQNTGRAHVVNTDCQSPQCVGGV